MTALAFEDVNNEIVKIEPKDVRHIEETSNSHGLDVFILHLYSQGEEIEVLHTNSNMGHIKHLLQQ